MEEMHKLIAAGVVKKLNYVINFAIFYKIIRGIAQQNTWPKAGW